MGISEIVMHIVLKAIECDKIKFDRNSYDDERIEKANAFNAKQIADFYQAIFDKVNNPLMKKSENQ